MNKNLRIILFVLVFVLVLVGAWFLYDNLKDNVGHDTLSTQAPVTTEATGASESKGEDTTQASQSTEATEAPKQAPDFTVYTVDGEAVKLSDYFGKPIVLNFWASWCGPCKMEMPEFNKMAETLDGEVQFLMVNMTDGSRETVETASQYVAKEGFTFPVFYDTSSEAMMAYGAYALPTTYFIDSNGYPVAYANGAIDSETLQKGIDMITGK